MTKPLIFLHGTFGEPNDWLTVINSRKLGGHDCSTLTLPGHARSPALKGHLAHHYTDWLLTEIKKISKGSVNFVGYSLGGRIGLGAMAKSPELFDKSILIGANPGIDPAKKSRRLKNELKILEQLERLSSQEFFSMWLESPLFIHLKKSPGYQEYYRRRCESLNSAEVIKVMKAMALSCQPDYSPILKTLSQRTLYISGGLDQKYAIIGRRIEYWGAKFEQIQGCGHYPLLDFGDELAELIGIFLKPQETVEFPLGQTKPSFGKIAQELPK